MIIEVMLKTTVFVWTERIVRIELSSSEVVMLVM